MKINFTIDLENLGLDYLQHKLETEKLSAGRRILKEDLKERFATLRSLGIYNLQDLIEVLKTPKKMEQFAVQSGIPLHYLTVLRLEAYSYIPKPFNLEKIPGIDQEKVQRLQNLGIKNTRQLFENAYTSEYRVQLAQKSGLSQDDLLEFASMADLARVYGIGPVFVRILIDAGVTTVNALENCKPETLYNHVVRINQEKGYTKIMPNLNDMRICIEFAGLLPLVLEE